MIVAITGTPGTGKTEVAKTLSKTLRWGLVELNKLAEEKKLYAGRDRKRKCRIIDLDGISREVSKLKGNWIIESHYAQDMPVDVVVVLRLNPGKLRERLKKRAWPKEKIDENILAEIMEVCASDAMEQDRPVIEIDVTNKSVDSVVKEIVRFLKNLQKSRRK